MLGQAFPAVAMFATPLGWVSVIAGATLYWWAGILYLLQTVRISGMPVRSSGNGPDPAHHPRPGGSTVTPHRIRLTERRSTVAEHDEKYPATGAYTPGAVDDGAPTSGSGDREVDTTLTFGEDLGAALAALDCDVTAEEHEAIAALPSGSALLIVRRGPNNGARFLLDSDVTVAGRHPEADIFLDDVTVSRRHAEFHRHGTAFEVDDLGSLNGTYFDGVRIDRALLSDGAEVQVGKFRLTFYPSRLDLATLPASSGARTARAARVRGSPELLSIGQVLARFTPEFPDLTSTRSSGSSRSAGWSRPARTESGYRKFSPATTSSGCASILTMQRDHYLPLKVISQLPRRRRRWPRPLLPGSATDDAPSMLPGGRRLSRDELIARGRRHADAAPRRRLGLCHPAGRDLRRRHPGGARRPWSSCSRSGIEPRHLRGFRAAAERELGLIESAACPRRPAQRRVGSRAGGRAGAGDRRPARDRAASLVRSALGDSDPPSTGVDARVAVRRSRHSSRHADRFERMSQR